MVRELCSQTYDLILEGMKLLKVMLAFTETCIDNNSTNSGSLVFEKRMLKTKNTFLRMVFDLYECMWLSVLVHEDSLIFSYLPRRTIDFDFMLLLFLLLLVFVILIRLFPLNY